MGFEQGMKNCDGRLETASSWKQILYLEILPQNTLNTNHLETVIITKYLVTEGSKQRLKEVQ